MSDEERGPYTTIPVSQFYEMRDRILKLETTLRTIVIFCTDIPDSARQKIMAEIGQALK